MFGGGIYLFSANYCRCDVKYFVAGSIQHKVLCSCCVGFLEAYVLPALSHVEAQEPKAKGDATPMVTWLRPFHLFAAIRELFPCENLLLWSGFYCCLLPPVPLSPGLLFDIGFGCNFCDISPVRFDKRCALIYHSLHRLSSCGSEVLILAPTRELAVQISDMTKAAASLGIRLGADVLRLILLYTSGCTVAAS